MVPEELNEDGLAIAHRGNGGELQAQLGAVACAMRDLPNDNSVARVDDVADRRHQPRIAQAAASPPQDKPLVCRASAFRAMRQRRWGIHGSSVSVSHVSLFQVDKDPIGIVR